MKISILMVVSFGVLVGAPFVSGGLIAEMSEENLAILYQIRIPRILTLFLVGGGLTICGIGFQSLLRNPLASPYTLGTSSGAALGAVLGIVSGWYFSWGFLDSITLMSHLGSFISMMIVYSFAKKNGFIQINTLLLAGVAVGLTFASFILFVQYLSDTLTSNKIIHWLMGSVEVVGMETPLKIFIPLCLGTIYIMKKGYELELISIGDEFALSRGIDINAHRFKIYLVLSCMVAVIVSECGPIGFVGIMVPHMARKFFGRNMNLLLSAGFFVGGIFLIICDILSRSLFPMNIPIGVITAFCGGPFFLILLRRNGFSKFEG